MDSEWELSGGGGESAPLTGAASPIPGLELLKNIELPLTLRFGSAQISLKELAALSTGSVIELDRALTDPVEVLVGGSVIARGEPIVVQGVYGIRISEVSSRHERLITNSLQTTPSSEGSAT